MIPEDVIDEMIAVLNRALSADPRAIRALFSKRVQCGAGLLEDPTIQCNAEPPSVGPMGLINGLCGVDENGCGPICYVTDLFGSLVRFQRFRSASDSVPGHHELQKRIRRLRDAIGDSEVCIEEHGRNGLTTFDNLRRMADDVLALMPNGDATTG